MKRLAQLGKPVRAIVRSPEKYKDDFAGLGSSVTTVKGDVTDPESMARALAGVTGIIFTASGKSYWSARSVDELVCLRQVLLTVGPLGLILCLQTAPAFCAGGWQRCGCGKSCWSKTHSSDIISASNTTEQVGHNFIAATASLTALCVTPKHLLQVSPNTPNTEQHSVGTDGRKVPWCACASLCPFLFPQLQIGMHFLPVQINI